MFVLLLVAALGAGAEDFIPFDDDPAITPSPDPTESPTPTPHPTPNHPPMTLLEIISPFEISMAALALVFLVFFIAGTISIRSTLKKDAKNVLNEFDNHFSVVPKNFVKYAKHKYAIYMTGRTSYTGCLITINFSHRCDPFMYLWDLIRQNKSKLVIEFLPKPKQNVSMMFHVSSKAPKSVSMLKLEEFGVSDENLVGYTDLGNEKELFSTDINMFIEKHPKVLEFVEICDSNRHDMRRESRYVARFEFDFDAIIKQNISTEVLNFALKLSDKFATLELPPDLLTKNLNLRTKLFMDTKEKYEEKSKKE